MQARVAKHTRKLGLYRSDYLETKAHNDGLEQENRNRIARIKQLETQITQLNERLKQAFEHIKTLTKRRGETSTNSPASTTFPSR